jgi:hypothetical protein
MEPLYCETDGSESPDPPKRTRKTRKTGPRQGKATKASFPEGVNHCVTLLVNLAKQRNKKDSHVADILIEAGFFLPGSEKTLRAKLASRRKHLEKNKETFRTASEEATKYFQELPKDSDEYLQFKAALDSFSAPVLNNQHSPKDESSVSSVDDELEQLTSTFQKAKITNKMNSNTKKAPPKYGPYLTSKTVALHNGRAQKLDYLSYYYPIPPGTNVEHVSLKVVEEGIDVQFPRERKTENSVLVLGQRVSNAEPNFAAEVQQAMNRENERAERNLYGEIIDTVHFCLPKGFKVHKNEVLDMAEKKPGFDIGPGQESERDRYENPTTSNVHAISFCVMAAIEGDASIHMPHGNVKIGGFGGGNDGGYGIGGMGNSSGFAQGFGNQWSGPGGPPQPQATFSAGQGQGFGNQWSSPGGQPVPPPQAPFSSGQGQGHGFHNSFGFAQGFGNQWSSPCGPPQPQATFSSGQGHGFGNESVPVGPTWTGFGNAQSFTFGSPTAASPLRQVPSNDNASYFTPRQQSHPPFASRQQQQQQHAVRFNPAPQGRPPSEVSIDLTMNSNSTQNIRVETVDSDQSGSQSASL